MSIACWMVQYAARAPSWIVGSAFGQNTFRRKPRNRSALHGELRRDLDELEAVLEAGSEQTAAYTVTGGGRVADNPDGIFGRLETRVDDRTKGRLQLHDVSVVSLVLELLLLVFNDGAKLLAQSLVAGRPVQRLPTDYLNLGHGLANRLLAQRTMSGLPVDRDHDAVRAKHACEQRHARLSSENAVRFVSGIFGVNRADELREAHRRYPQSTTF